MDKLGRKCSGCTACKSICPVSAIIMEKDAFGFEYPYIDKEHCISCNKCLSVCPWIKKQIEKVLNYPSEFAFAAKSKIEDLQLSATSGGFFSSLAKFYVEELNGVVYGAAYNERYKVEICRVDNACDLKKLAESKYVQAVIGDSFNAVKNDLQDGRFVLYSGTPCQVGGLKAFLQKDYDNLLTVDLICHGVPSPLVWEYYINIFSSMGNIKHISHRGKDRNGWNWQRQFLSIEFEDGHIFKENIWDNAYMRGFLKDFYLRDSCYECIFKNSEVRRPGDLSIADFWGCEIEEKDFFDGNGVSLVICNTDKGKDNIHKLDNILRKETNIKSALKYNIAAMQSYAKPWARRLFWKMFSTSMSLIEFEQLIKRCECILSVQKFILKILRPFYKIRRIIYYTVNPRMLWKKIVKQ